MSGESYAMRKHSCEKKPDSVTIYAKSSYSGAACLDVTVGGLGGLDEETAYMLTTSFEILFCPFCGAKVDER